MDEIVNDFLHTAAKNQEHEEKSVEDEFDAEVRIGLGSCCVAGGSRDVLGKLLDIRNYYDLNIR